MGEPVVAEGEDRFRGDSCADRGQGRPQKPVLSVSGLLMTRPGWLC